MRIFLMLQEIFTFCILESTSWTVKVTRSIMYPLYARALKLLRVRKILHQEIHSHQKSLELWKTYQYMLGHCWRATKLLPTMGAMFLPGTGWISLYIVRFLRSVLTSILRSLTRRTSSRGRVLTRKMGGGEMLCNGFGFWKRAKRWKKAILIWTLCSKWLRASKRGWSLLLRFSSFFSFHGCWCKGRFSRCENQFDARWRL